MINLVILSAMGVMVVVTAVAIAWAIGHNLRQGLANQQPAAEGAQGC